MSGQESENVEGWELELVSKVARAFRTSEREELEAELAQRLLELKREPHPGVRNWKPYLAKTLYNYAARLITKWRDRQKREESLEEWLRPSVEEEGHDWMVQLELVRLRRQLDPAAYNLLELVVEARGNQSRVAQWLGVHRNTVRNRLRSIRQVLRRPIENVSSPRAPPAPDRTLALSLTDEQRRQLLARALARERRAAFRARLILALESGQSYRRIAEELNTTAPTISRWKHRFERQGIEGLSARHPGKQKHTATRTLVARWLRSHPPMQDKIASCRRLAQELGLSKSTVYRILKELSP